MSWGVAFLPRKAPHFGADNVPELGSAFSCSVASLYTLAVVSHSTVTSFLCSSLSISSVPIGKA